MIKRFFTKAVDIERLVRKGGNNPDKDTEIWEPHLSGVMCHIQTWAEGSVGYEGAKFPTHLMWCDIDVDIIEGDRVIDGTNIYEVLNIEELDYGENPHLQITLSLVK